MAIKRLATIALLAMGAYAQASVGTEQKPILDESDAAETLSDTTSSTTPGLSELKVTAEVSFPDASVLGIKLVNGRATTALFKVKNGEDDPIKVRVIGGSLWSLGTADLKKTQAVRNLTATKYTKEIAAKSEATLTYKFTNELHPQDLQLVLAGIFADKSGNAFQLEGFNGTVSVVEAPFSIFDPQILFLYAFLAAAFVGTLYFIYNTWIAQYFPQTKKRSTRITAPSRPSNVSVAASSDSSATTGAKAYDESWIDARHLNRPEAKRVGSSKTSGTPKTRAK